MISEPQSAIGPASVGALPDLGSVHPRQDFKMNENSNATEMRDAPASRDDFTVSQLAEALTIFQSLNPENKGKALARVRSLAAQDKAPLILAIEKLEQAYAAWVGSVSPEEDLPAEGPLYDAYNEAEQELIGFPCTTYEEVHTKIGYIFGRGTGAARTTSYSFTDCGNLHLLLSSLLGRSLN